MQMEIDDTQDINWYDTAGLLTPDIEELNLAVISIQKAINCAIKNKRGVKLVFVMTDESGRVKANDLFVIETIMRKIKVKNSAREASNNKNNYSVIFNKFERKTYESDAFNRCGRLAFSELLNDPDKDYGTDFVSYILNEDYLKDKDDAVFEEIKSKQIFQQIVMETPTIDIESFDEIDSSDLLKQSDEFKKQNQHHFNTIVDNAENLDNFSQHKKSQAQRLGQTLFNNFAANQEKIEKTKCPATEMITKIALRLIVKHNLSQSIFGVLGETRSLKELLDKLKPLQRHPNELSHVVVESEFGVDQGVDPSEIVDQLECGRSLNDSSNEFLSLLKTLLNLKDDNYTNNWHFFGKMYFNKLLNEVLTKNLSEKSEYGMNRSVFIYLLTKLEPYFDYSTVHKNLAQSLKPQKVKKWSISSNFYEGIKTSIKGITSIFRDDSRKQLELKLEDKKIKMFLGVDVNVAYLTEKEWKQEWISLATKHQQPIGLVKFMFGMLPQFKSKFQSPAIQNSIETVKSDLENLAKSGDGSAKNTGIVKLVSGGLGFASAGFAVLGLIGLAPAAIPIGLIGLGIGITSTTLTIGSKIAYTKKGNELKAKTSERSHDALQYLFIVSNFIVDTTDACILLNVQIQQNKVLNKIFNIGKLDAEGQFLDEWEKMEIGGIAFHTVIEVKKFMVEAGVSLKSAVGGDLIAEAVNSSFGSDMAQTVFSTVGAIGDVAYYCINGLLVLVTSR